MKRAVAFLLVWGSLTVLAAPGMGANLILKEDFDDRSVNPVIGVYSTNWTKISPPAYGFGTGRTGTGYSLAAGTFHCPRLCWFPSTPWPSDEMYVSYWCRFENFRSTSSHENIKMTYAHWDGANSYANYAIASPTSLYYSAHDKSGSVLEQSSWPGTGSIVMTDGNWHRWEYWVKFSTSQVKLWIDGVLIDENDYANGAWTNNVYYIHAPAQDSESVGSFTRSIDDWEVWDGMPSSTPQDTTPPVISGARASSVAETSATITWTTNEPATSQVDYGPTTSYGSSTAATTTRVTAHSVTLSGLTAQTSYNFRVRSADAAGNTSTSANQTFVTTSVAAAPGKPGRPVLVSP